jgi:hypothetical protein
MFYKVSFCEQVVILVKGPRSRSICFDQTDWSRAFATPSPVRKTLVSAADTENSVPTGATQVLRMSRAAQVGEATGSGVGSNVDQVFFFHIKSFDVLMFTTTSNLLKNFTNEGQTKKSFKPTGYSMRLLDPHKNIC